MSEKNDIFVLNIASLHLNVVFMCQNIKILSTFTFIILDNGTLLEQNSTRPTNFWAPQENHIQNKPQQTESCWSHDAYGKEIIVLMKKVKR